MIAIDALIAHGIAAVFFKEAFDKIDTQGRVDYGFIYGGLAVASIFFLIFLIFIVAVNELAFTRKALEERNKLVRGEI